jgi:hypothetical protein
VNQATCGRALIDSQFRADLLVLLRGVAPVSMMRQIVISASSNR